MLIFTKECNLDVQRTGFQILTMGVPCGMSGESGEYIRIKAALIDFWPLGLKKKKEKSL